MILENKKGNIYLTILMAFMLFSVGMLVANFLKSPIDDARANLDCSNAAGISDGNKLLCLTIDSSMIYFIILVVSLAGGAILDRVII